jgi:CCR4-NOT complex subunit CAF16
VQVRDDLLSFLKADSERRTATILCGPRRLIPGMLCGGLTYRKITFYLDATHIFDGLNEFPTHVAHMRLGSFVMNATPWPIDPSLDNKVGVPDGTLFQIALRWLREDREHRRELEKGGRKTRGAKRDQVPQMFHMGDLGSAH